MEDSSSDFLVNFVWYLMEKKVISCHKSLLFHFLNKLYIFSCISCLAIDFNKHACVCR